MSDDPNTLNTLPVPTDAGEIEREIANLEEPMKDTKGDYCGNHTWELSSPL